MGETLFELIELYAMHHFDPAAALPTIQLAVGIKGGCEIAVHAIRSALQSFEERAEAPSTVHRYRVGAEAM
jgi:hypothetical protein